MYCIACYIDGARHTAYVRHHNNAAEACNVSPTACCCMCQESYDHPWSTALYIPLFSRFAVQLIVSLLRKSISYFSQTDLVILNW